MKEKIIILIIALVVLISVVVGILILFQAPAIGISGKVALIRVEGTITSSKGIFGGTSSEEIVKQIKQAREDFLIKAILIRINSPGGSAAASQEIYMEIMKTRNSGKPVVVSMGDAATSGGYYIASAANRIVAAPGTLTGSIGVIWVHPVLSRFFEEWGIQFEIVKSGPYKDIGAVWRNFTEEEWQLAKEAINDTYDQFVEDVAKGRNISVEKIKQIADGRILTGRQAKELGLVDALGNIEDATKLAADLAGIEKPVVVELKKRTLFEALFGTMGEGISRGIVKGIIQLYLQKQIAL
ncbi:MAG: signal peptide peptidase SppA [Euryarchaeota archaeon]|nr:signal peptide peptidase SppA [Euryarchaeota archaeon]